MLRRDAPESGTVFAASLNFPELDPMRKTVEFPREDLFYVQLAME
jgi:hypothetical protein